MTLEGTYETKLLRMIIGFLHVSLSQQLALTRYGKPFQSLTPEEKNSLQEEMVTGVLAVADNVSEEALQNFLNPFVPPGPLGPIH